MNVVWHKQGEMCVPDTLCISVDSCFKYLGRYRSIRQLVLAARHATNCNEIIRLAWIDPEWRFVRQLFAIPWHLRRGKDVALRLPPTALNVLQMVRTAQRAVPTNFHNCLSSVFQRAQASSRAFLSPSRTFGLFGSPERMNP